MVSGCLRIAKLVTLLGIKLSQMVRLKSFLSYPNYFLFVARNPTNLSASTDRANCDWKMWSSPVAGSLFGATRWGFENDLKAKNGNWQGRCNAGMIKAMDHKFMTKNKFK